MITNLKNLTIVNPNYIACLMWKDQNGNVHRYQLWSGVGETKPLGWPLYNGQIIKKNFRIEIWSLSGSDISETVGQNFITSVLQGVDYRYGVDGTLKNNDGQVTNFLATNTTPTVNTPPQTNLDLWWRADDIAGGTDWVARVGISTNITNNAGTALTTAVIGGITYLDLSAGFATKQNTAIGTSTLANSSVFVVFKKKGTPSGNTNFLKLIAFNTAHTDIAIKTDDTLIVDNQIAGMLDNSTVYLLDVTSDNFGDTLGAVYSVPLCSSLYFTPNITQIASQLNKLEFNSTPVYISEILVYSVITPDASALLKTYLCNYYGQSPMLVNLPITFPANSTPQPNII